ncbi:MAG: electron transport complex subunit RsxG [Gammaproteobacteria bacterium]|nr:electron transport complex subunit RsxG [Gammaproteobacteria bacterium]
MASLKTHIFRVGLMLAVFAIVATSLVAMTEANTREKISENEQQALLKAINQIVDSSDYNNAILSDTLTISKNKLLGTKQDTIVYRARFDAKPVAAVFTSVAPNGYSGEIKLLIGVYYDGSIAGARVISHKETPGLGDKINEQKSDWIRQFKGLSLTNPAESKWKVKKDGGSFDQFTGATITPRAVVDAVKKALEYFNKNRDTLFEVTPDE